MAFYVDESRSLRLFCRPMAPPIARWHGEGKLRPHVSQIFPLRRAADALKLMAMRQVKGKPVLVPH
ncbi:MAG: hypothetical protein EPO20_19130 [Betaproteobacteria bacterium]|nr:MAG: hypothetical protein EPO20_19130 [Betaproteobacteria bacterium]